jgi:hypothetical protein
MFWPSLATLWQMYIQTTVQFSSVCTIQTTAQSAQMHIQRHGERSLHSPFKPQHSLHSPAVQFSLNQFSWVQSSSVQFSLQSAQNLNSSSTSSDHRICTKVQSKHQFWKHRICTKVQFKHQFWTQNLHKSSVQSSSSTSSSTNTELWSFANTISSELFTVKFSQHNQFTTLINVPAIQFTITDRCTFSNIQSAKWQLSHSTKFSLPNSAKSQYKFSSVK